MFKTIDSTFKSLNRQGLSSPPHEDGIRLELPEFISFLLSYLNCRSRWGLKNNSPYLHEKTRNWRILEDIFFIFILLASPKKKKTDKQKERWQGHRNSCGQLRCIVKRRHRAIVYWILAVQGPEYCPCTDSTQVLTTRVSIKSRRKPVTSQA